MVFRLCCVILEAWIHWFIALSDAEPVVFVLCKDIGDRVVLIV